MARAPKASAKKAALRVRRRPGTVHLDTVRLEGGILSSAMLAAVVAREGVDQAEADYGIRKGLVLKDEVARFFRIGRALHGAFTATRMPSPEATEAYVAELLREVFEFGDLAPAPAREAAGRPYAIALEASGGRVPVAVATPAEGLETPTPRLAMGGRRASAASTVQDWLDATDAATWGIATDGQVFRVLRDNASLTRPASVDVDLGRIFEAEALGEFTAAWLLLHASRFGRANAAPADCPLERWRAASARQGEAARERLREGVEAALEALSTGFLDHPQNGTLRDRVAAEPGALGALFGACLDVVYRAIFLFAAEDRDLLHPPGADPATRALYAEGYSMGALRARAARSSSYDAHHDLWEGVGIVFGLLGGAGGPAAALGLPVLGGLFAGGMPAPLAGALLSNRALMAAVRRLAWLDGEAGLVPVNWRDMETEELGSVYESLLELTPRLAEGGRALTFAEGAEAKGNQRKTTGSYYTPDSLVQALLDSALDPVLDRIAAEGADPAEALLGTSVIDPACGSGHFLLAAARRIATRVARHRHGGAATAAQYRHALRDVARRCIFGVDRNPMAVELTRVALWIETVDPGLPLGFLDANIRCGDALFGAFDLTSLDAVPAAAYRPLTGDDRAAAKHYEKRNREERGGQGALDFAGGGGALPPAASLASEAEALRALPEDTPAEVEEKRRRFTAAEAGAGRYGLYLAADLQAAAFLLPKRAVPANRNMPEVPTTAHLRDARSGRQVYGPLVGRTQDAAAEARAFHWPLAFPDVWARGGFDAVLGNPPWERVKLQEQEFFASRDPEIAGAPNAAARGRLIAALREAEPGTARRALYEAFERAKRAAEASSAFARVPAEDGGRFPLAGRGDVNTYALFAELFAQLTSPRGRAGVIVPTGIATDATTAPFFSGLISNEGLISLFSFFEIRKIFPDTDDRNSFCLLTIGRQKGAAPEFAFHLTRVDDLAHPERRFSLTAAEIARINPNTRTAPIFRSRADAALTAQFYARVPVLIDEARGREGNPWGLSFMAMFHMSNDSDLFRTAAQLATTGLIRQGTDWVSGGGARPAQGALALAGGADRVSLPLDGAPGRAPVRYVPLYEAKMVHQFDHRWATYDGADSQDATAAEHADPAFEPVPRYWVPERDVEARLADKGWTRGWLMGWRDIARATDERTVIATAFPREGCGDTLLLMMPDIEDFRRTACLLANTIALPLDYSARQKVGGTHLKYNVFKQLPLLPPHAYTAADLAFIVPRVLELTYTSHSMAPFARDLGHDGPPFAWNEDRRAWLRAELDARYARLYGLTRDELRYVLDPADVRGLSYPSETFRVLKANEIRRFGEYRTARLVLAAWDSEAAGLHAAAE